MVFPRMKKLGSEVRKRRRKKGMTQKQLAEKINCSNTYISKIESGVLDPEKEGPSQDLVRKLAMHLILEGESPYDLFLYFWADSLSKLPKELERELVLAMVGAPESSEVSDFTRSERKRSISSFDFDKLRTLAKRFEQTNDNS